ncbi:MAG: DUF4331 domain-containing protein [Gemmatimonadetes bacterium]|nr:DUF4331 domain-containing protein [Gemmatimonadota bacterium]
MRRTMILATAALGLALATTACVESTSPEFDAVFGGAATGQIFLQGDRFGLPAIATVFVPAAQRDAYNTAIPANDRRDYSDEVVAVLRAFGQTADAAEGLARALLPDVQPINTATPSGFLNGRRLEDDVITAELGLIFGSNAALNDDHVDANDKPFLARFPYLAGPTVN